VKKRWKGNLVWQKDGLWTYYWNEKNMKSYKDDLGKVFGFRRSKLGLKKKW